MKILIIEDQEKLAKTLKRELEREGYTAEYLTDGEAGLKRIRLHHESYDLVILDLMLPVMNGFEICKKVRELNINTPILVLTAKDSTEDKVSLLNAGADDYLTKPFLFQELLARIRSVLRRPQVATPPGKIEVKNLVLNPVTRKAYRNGKEIVLTMKEFSLLEYLMLHPNAVVTRDQILDNLWDFAFDSFSNVVDVHVHKLRKKINDEGDEILETVWGTGYRLKG